MRKKILVIDDNNELNQVIVQGLRRKGFQVFSATRGREGLKLAFETQPDLVVLDIMMPEMDGWQTCERLREISDIPIIFLTAKTSQDDIIRGFQLGVDDYITKPFSLRELELRVCAVLKRAEAQKSTAVKLYDDGTLKIDLESQQVYREEQIVHLTPTEFRLLSCLVRHKGSLVPHEYLLTEVWSTSHLDAMSSLALYISYLRKKLEEDPREPRYIRTEWGVGYWFAPQNGSDHQGNTAG